MQPTDSDPARSVMAGTVPVSSYPVMCIHWYSILFFHVFSFFFWGCPSVAPTALTPSQRPWQSWYPFGRQFYNLHQSTVYGCKQMGWDGYVGIVYSPDGQVDHNLKKNIKKKRACAKLARVLSFLWPSGVTFLCRQRPDSCQHAGRRLFVNALCSPRWCYFAYRCWSLFQNWFCCGLFSGVNLLLFATC